MSQAEFWETVRNSVIGNDLVLETCFGARRIVYADYTASGRAVSFVEDYLRDLLASYANTHTEDDAGGRATTARLQAAERSIKRLVNAGDQYAVIAVGAGTTGAVQRLQQILGLYVAPASRDRMRGELVSALGEQEAERVLALARRHRPVVFVGPYEHHSNELSWRESNADVVEVELDTRGLLDLQDLERKVADPKLDGRVKIGAFSAGSNVTGITTPVHEVARILHRYGCLAFFDFAAVAPYRRIDVAPDGEACFDAIYFSPHKFLGGPGSSGILVFRRELYRGDLPPTFAGGGTVEFVNWDSQDYAPDIEIREKAGTPPILQTMRAALAMELKEALGVGAIVERERRLIRVAIERLRKVDEVEIVGNDDPENRLAILSFVIRAGKSYLHPRFVTELLNDLFGIQSRAGCLCAGPYGHRLLHIDRARSAEFRRAIHEGRFGLKPGWTRVNFHYLLSDEEAAFICEAIEIVARGGLFFLPLYEFDLREGAWRHREWVPPVVRFGLEEALSGARESATREAPALGAVLEEARRLAAERRDDFDPSSLKSTERDLVPFVYVHASGEAS